MKLEVRQPDGTWLEIGEVSIIGDGTGLDFLGTVGTFAPGTVGRLVPDNPLATVARQFIQDTLVEAERQKPPFWAKTWKGQRS